MCGAAIKCVQILRVYNTLEKSREVKDYAVLFPTLYVDFTGIHRRTLSNGICEKGNLER